MQAWDNSLEWEVTKAKGENEIASLCEGFGVMECNNLDHEEYLHGKQESAMNLVSAERSSDSHYDFAFEFTYEFSTSTNPRTAGMPSDVIIGGGMDVIVSDIIQGGYICIHSSYLLSCSYRSCILSTPIHISYLYVYAFIFIL